MAALLFALPAAAIAAPGTGQNINGQTVATVTNAAGQSITSIVITNSTVTGAVTNAGTITPGINVPNTGATEGVFVGQSTILGGVLNSGTIAAVGKGSDTLGIFITGSSVSAGSASGAVVNSGSIMVSGGAVNASGLAVQNSTVMGDVSNTGTTAAS